MCGVRFEVAALLCADSLVYFVVKGLADWSVLALTETKGTPTLTYTRSLSLFNSLRGGERGRREDEC